MKTTLLVLFCAFSIMLSAQGTTDSSAEIMDQNKVYRNAEVDSKPELKDGIYQLSMFVSNNLSLPELENLKVKIHVNFVVEKDGLISNVKFVKQTVTPISTDYPELTAEQKEKEKELLKQLNLDVVRVVGNYKKPFKPAMQNGKPVRCLYNFPITIMLE